jgi:hypothetical protein
MSEYTLQEELSASGFSHSIGSQPVEETDWKVREKSSGVVVIEHPEGVEVQIKQIRPKYSDLPYRAIRVSKGGNVSQIGESDWVAEVLTTAIAYMKGFSERGAS